MAHDPAVASAPRDLPPRPWVLLLVDDEPDILESTKDMIEGSLRGTKVVPKASGREGLAYLGTQPVDLIISDFKMPGMDGIEFLCECRRLYPAIPRVMLTAYPSDELADRAIREAFVDSFLSKAGDPEVLVDAVAKLVEALKKKGP